MLRYPPMTEGYIFLPRAVRPEVKKYNPRSEVDHLSIYTDKEVVFLRNFDFTPLFFPKYTFFSDDVVFFLKIGPEVKKYNPS